MSPFFSVFLLTVALFLAFIVNLSAKPKTAARLTGVAMIITGIGSILSYTYGYAAVCDNLVVAAIKAMLSTAGSFLGQEDISAISAAPLFQNPVSLAILWVLHLIAFFTTASAAMITVGAGILRRLRLLLARRGDLILIYGTHDGAISFGRRMVQRRRTSVVFVDKSPAAGSPETIRGLGSLLLQDSSAVTPDHRFLRSLGIRDNKRRIWLYALSRSSAENNRYAADFLKALEKRGIPSAQTTLTLLGREDSLQNAFLAGERYGYGSVTVMDEAEMAARLLVRNVPPYRSLTFDKNGQAQQDLHCLIVGFGQVGQAVLQQTVINGQFVGSTFRAAVFAPDCTSVSGLLSAQAEELMKRYDISFFDCDARSRRMYDYLAEHGSGVNYVAVCTGNDKLNQEIAGELLRYFGRRGRRVPIALCSHSGVQLLQNGEALRQWSLYSPDVLCGDKLDRKARLLNHIYCNNQLSAEENWRDCNYFNRTSSRAAADFSPAFLHMAGLTAADVARDGWDPKGQLLTNLAQTEHMRWCAFHYAMGFSKMDRAEHLRRARVYAEEVLRTGESRYNISKDMRRRLHACLVPWEELKTLDAAENAITDGSVNYQKKDCNNVTVLADLLRIEEEEIL